MKKKLFLAFLVTILTMLGSYAYAEENVNVTINDEPIIFDSQPILKNDRILVPIRKIAEKMLFEVTWNQENKEVTLENYNTILKCKVDEYNITKDLKFATRDYAQKITNVKVDIPISVINDTTFVPLRAISELFGAEVNWNSTTNTAEIFYANTYGKEVIFENDGIEYLTKLELLIEGINHDKGLESFSIYITPDIHVEIDNKTVDRLYTAKIHEGALSKIKSLAICFYNPSSAVSSSNDINKFPNLIDKEAYISFFDIPRKFQDVIDTCITSNMTNREKIIAINRWISSNIHYDHEYTQYNKLLERYSGLVYFTNIDSLTFEPTMLNHYAVCTGFAKTFETFCDMLNIPCIYISGTANNGSGNWERHAWNVIKTEDNNFFHVDTCWNTADIEYPSYLLLTSNELNKIGNHIWNEEDIIKEFNIKYKK